MTPFGNDIIDAFIKHNIKHATIRAEDDDEYEYLRIADNEFQFGCKGYWIGNFEIGIKS